MDLLGLAGEIHAYRALRRKYGSGVVGPSSWKSENSRKVYPENPADDGFGCDFEIHAESRTYYIEVKASQGTEESLELGSSEVELALEKAGKRREAFQILHVVNALSQTPSFRLLPNPYDKRYREKYRFEDAGLRLRYEVGSPAGGNPADQ